jgi:hypothetical protein
MDLDEVGRLCDRLSELASRGPCRDLQALAQSRGILKQITQSPQATPHVRERASLVQRAMAGWLNSEVRFRAVLKSHSGEIYALIDQLHGALRDALRSHPRRP